MAAIVASSRSFERSTPEISAPSAPAMGCTCRAALMRTSRPIVYGPRAMGGPLGATAMLGRAVLAQQVARGVHDRHVRKGLREVAEQASGVRIVFLGEQSHVVADGQHALE